MKNPRKNLHRLHFFAAAAICLAVIILIGLRLNRPVWWKFLTNGEIYQEIAYRNNRIFVGNANGIFYAVDNSSGKELWKHATDHAISSKGFFYGKSVIFSTEDGGIIALNTNTGEELWRYTSPDLFRFVTPPELASGTLVIADANNSLFALDANTGKLRWKFTQPTPGNPDDGPIASFVVAGGEVYFTGSDGTLYALSLKTGNPVWKFNGGSQITAPVTSRGNNVYIGTAKGDSFGISGKTGKPLWHATAGKAISRISPLTIRGGFSVLSDHTVFVSFLNTLDMLFPSIRPVLIFSTDGTVIRVDNAGRNVWTSHLGSSVFAPKEWLGTLVLTEENGALVTLDLATGKTRWTKDSGGSIRTDPFIVYSAPNIFNPVVLVGNENGNLKAYTLASGNVTWQASCTGRIIRPPVLVQYNLLYTCTDGGIYKINLWGSNPDISGTNMSISREAQRVGNSEIAEFTVRHEDRQYPNPFDDVVVTAVFKHEGGVSVSVDGFYYDKNVWKVRFNPPKIGQWTWTINFKTPGGTLSKSGSFTSRTDSSASYLHIDNINTLRLTQNGSSVFNGMGINNAIVDYNHNGNPLDDWYIGDNTTVPLDTFVKTYGQGGFNIYRWSINNASFALTDSFTTQSKFLLTEGKYGDKLVSTLKQNGFHIWLTMFGFGVPLHDMNNPNEQRALRTYIRYVMARYGAYVSIWEIANEAYAKDAIVDFIAQEIHAADFENRPVSMSWEHPELSSVTVTAPHAYIPQKVTSADTDMITLITKYTRINKPILFGEMGNSDINWSPDSALIMRVRSWVSFFKGTILVFWNQSNIKNNYNPVLKNANQYIGPEERSYMANLERFTDGIAIDAQPTNMQSLNPQVRSYGILSSKEILGYFYHFADPSTPTSTSTTIYIPRSASVTWYDPVKGSATATEHYSSGTYTLATPVFTADMALKISFTDK